jgi:tetratricopeptide (TPR) repeat protein
MDYTAVGQTTHLAARMEQMAIPGSILVTPDTLHMAEGYVVVRPLGERTVRGLGAPLEVYELTGARAVRSRLHVAAGRGLTGFVGRDHELETLGEALDAARAGRGQVVAVVGGPGVGKSRLYWEFTHSHRSQGWLVLESRSVSYGKATAYLPIVDLLRACFQIQPRDGAPEVREKVTGKLLSLDRALEPALPALLWLLDVPVEDAPWDGLEPAQRRQRALDGVRQLLLRESQVQPLLVCFEDLHWIDDETQALLDALVESVPTARLLLLVNYRPEYQHGWSRKPYYRQLRIDPLRPESAGALLDTLLGDDPSLPPLKRLLIERTDGNPFFLEESVRALVETKALVGERGAYRLARAQHTLQIPATAQAILAARIDRLAPEDKRLLQEAAVIGKDVPFALLQGIANLDEAELRRGLAALQDAEFLYETSLFPDLELSFKHALTQEVAYASLPREPRRRYHEQIARTLEVFFADRLDEKADLLAGHYRHGGNIEKAVDYLTRAARRAVARFASEEACRHYEGVIACLDQLPPTEDRVRERIQLRFEELEMVWARGEYRQGWLILEELQAAAERLGDLPRLAQIHIGFGWQLYDQLELDRALAHHQAAFAVCERLGQVAPSRWVYWGLGATCRSLSADVDVRRRHAIEFHRRGLALAEAALPDVAWYDVHNAHFPWLVYLLQLGDPQTALVFLERGERIARALDPGVGAVHGALLAGSTALTNLLTGQQETHGCLDVLRESLAALERVGHHVLAAVGHHLLAQGYVVVGDHPSARPHFEVLLRASELTRVIRPGALLGIAETEAQLGRAGEAVDHLRAYEALIGEVGSIEGLAWMPSAGVADRIHGLLLGRQGRVDEALQRLGQGIKLLAEHGYRPDLARTWATLGRLHRDGGRLREARACLETAAHHYREMGFGLELRRVLGELDSLRAS